ncbi:hypothetical protein OOK36_55895 [Streptomyces sp. NBC_00365]|uniref:hypothetical protein n=1 Tax=Streptomyces sp. NBC_00365 TaxID=2975726 RepID=UPI00225759C8|nr:hypothetical protein [Streptomyces sp. NBC_00365]MCX5097740.1 hypothetical protein [Streptomyces sp. NBC_00365]
MPKSEGEGVGQELFLEYLTREQVLELRTRVAKGHQVVFDHVEQYGEHSAQPLFTRAFREGAAPVLPRAPEPRLHLPWG